MRHDSWTPSAPETKRPSQPAIRTANLGPEYNKFLFAIAAEANGNAITVLSALARQDLDPWGEAAALSRMPSALAIQRLTRLLEAAGAAPAGAAPAGAAPAGQATTQAQIRRNATKLIALLPAAAITDIPAQLASGGAAIANARSMIAFLIIFMGVMLGIQCIAHFSHAPPHQGPATQTGQALSGIHAR